jgi:amino acid adenylation domain-containing protein
MDRTALCSETWRPTYRELDLASNRLANAFIARGGAPGDRIAILMPHDTPAIGALLATMKAGRIVVALNATDPPLRLRQLMADAEPTLIVADSQYRDLANEIATPGCAVVDFDEAYDFRSANDPSIAISPAQTAALTYTSGSTGRPKAVMMTHRQYLRNAMAHTQAMNYTDADRLPGFGSLSGGQGVTVVWSALLNGATLFPFPVAMKGVTGLADWIVDHGITVYISSASIFRNFMRTLDDGFAFPGVRAVRLASETATSDDFRLFQKHFRNDCVFVHGLSSSETCNIAFWACTGNDSVPEGRLPVGRISEGPEEVLLLDENDRRVGPGEVGEIVVRSRFVAAGYWRNPTLTAERFSEDLDGRGTRLVRTGDLGRISAEGFLEFAGRADNRIKLRGNRIELSDIEHALHQIPGIDRAVVETVAQVNREPMLVGFVMAHADESWSAVDLRRALRAMLPRHMVPSNFVFLESFPFTPTGKIDRERLRQMHAPRRGSAQDQEPRTETERMLADIWAEAFDLTDIGRHDDFFALGGDSLLAAVVAARAHAAVGVELNLGAFADHPTLARLAAAIDKLHAKGTSGPPLPAPAQRKGPAPLSLYQERTWICSQTAAESAKYTVARAHHIAGPIDAELLRECMSFIAKRHEILRTTIAVEGGHPVQVVHPPEPVALEFVDLSVRPDPEQEALRRCREESERGFDIAGGQLVRFALIRLRENEHWLLRVVHHIICDVWSWNLYFNELKLLYEAKLDGIAAPLPEIAPYQFGNYAVWQRQTLDPLGQAYKDAVVWWRDQLMGAPLSIKLPFGRCTQADDAPPADGVIMWGLDPGTSRRLGALARLHSTTPYVVRLAAFVALLADETGERDIVVGTYVNNRQRLELQNVFGYFINLATLRFLQQPSISFRNWLALTRSVVVGVEARSEIPYEQLRDELQQLEAPLPEIQVIFAVSGTEERLRIADLEFTTLERIFPVMPWGFSVSLNEHDEEHACRVDFDANQYDPAKVRLFIERLKRLYDAVSRHPELPVADLLTMSRADDPSRPSWRMAVSVEASTGRDGGGRFAGGL